MDNYYLNNAVYLVEDFLKTAKPPYEGEVDYGDRAEHCWNGDHTRPNATSRLRYHQMFAPKILERLLKTAPAGADIDELAILIPELTVVGDVRSGSRRLKPAGSIPAHHGLKRAPGQNAHVVTWPAAVSFRIRWVPSMM